MGVNLCMGCQVRGQWARVWGPRKDWAMDGLKISSEVILTRHSIDNIEVTLVPLASVQSTGSMLNSAQSSGYS
jgi:hypothetical protein